MEIALLIFAVLGLVIKVEAFHVILLLVHAVVGLWIAFRLLKTQPVTALLIGLYVVFYIPNPVALHLGLIDMDRLSTMDIVFNSNVFILAGLDIFILFATRFRSRKLTNFNDMPPIQIDGKLADLVIILMLAASSVAMIVLIFMGRQMGVNVLEIEKSFRTTVQGPIQAVYLITIYLSMMVPLATFLVALKRWDQQLLYLVPIVVIMLVYFLIFRVRTPPITIMTAYGVGVASRYMHVSIAYRRSVRQLPRMMKPALLIGLVLLGSSGIVIKYVRWSYEMQDMRLDQDRVQLLMDHTFAGGDLGYAMFTRSAMAVYPEHEPFLGGQSYYRVLFMPIPRFVWPNKPQNTGRLFAMAIEPRAEDVGLTITPGLAGDLYINFGYFGVLGMAGWGLLFARERYNSLTALLFLAGCGYWMLHFGRGSITSPLATAVFILLVSYLTNKFLRPVPIAHHPVRYWAGGQQDYRVAS